MAYNKKDLFIKAKKIAKKPNVFFIEDIISFLPCAKPTFYQYFPISSNEMNALKEILDKNRVSMKTKIRGKLANGSRAAELIALYKLIATDDERKALSMHIDHTTKGKEIPAMDMSKYSAEDLIQIVKAADEKKKK